MLTMESASESDMLIKTRPTSRTYCIKPLGRRVLCAVLHESRFEDYRPSGLIIPETVVRGNRNVGVVVGVGPEATSVAWGDQVELSRWTADGKGWWHNPLWDALRVPWGDGTRYVMTDPARRRGFELSGLDKWVFVLPEQILSRHCTFEERAAGLDAIDHQAIADRLIVRHLPWPDREGGLAIVRGRRRYNPVAQVLSAGDQVDQVMEGDWVYLAGLDVGAHFEHAAGVLSSVRMKDVAAWSPEVAGPVDFRWLGPPRPPRKGADHE